MKSRFLNLTAAALAAMTLAACGKGEHSQASGAGIGVGVTSSSETDVSSSREISQLRKMANTRDQKVAVTVAASTYIDPAIAFAANLSPMVKVQLGMGVPVMRSAADFDLAVNALPPADPFRAYLADISTSAASAPADDRRIQTADAIVRARALYAAAARGVMGWEVSPPGLFQRDPAEAELRTSWMRAHELGACVGAGLGGQLAKAMSDIVLRDPVAARTWGLRMSLALAKESAADVLASCEQTYTLSAARTLDGTGAKGSAWSVQTADGQVTYMSCVSTGCEATQNGIQLFGKGQYAGVSYQLAFARAAATSAERSQGTGSSISDKQSDRSDASVSVGK